MSIIKPITGQGNGTLSAAPWGSRVKSTLLESGWAESGKDMIHHDRLGNVAQEGKAEAGITNVHFIVMTCFADFDRCAPPPGYSSYSGITRVLN